MWESISIQWKFAWRNLDPQDNLQIKWEILKTINTDKEKNQQIESIRKKYQNMSDEQIEEAFDEILKSSINLRVILEWKDRSKPIGLKRTLLIIEEQYRFWLLEDYCDDLHWNF